MSTTKFSDTGLLFLALFILFFLCLLSWAFVFNDRDVSPLVLPTRLPHPGEINHYYRPAAGSGQSGGNSMEAWVACQLPALS